MLPLPRAFFVRPPQVVARELLGARLVRCIDGSRLAGIILETEAYDGEADLACHARAGLTPRTQIMYGEAGHAYVYFTYGVHWMLNVVTGPVGWPAAVLIRAIQPAENLDAIAQLRPPPKPSANGEVPKGWTDGPAKLCQALGITGALNGTDLCDAAGRLFIEPGEPVQDAAVVTGPRVGINYAPEPWKSIPWRYVGRMKEKG